MDEVVEAREPSRRAVLARIGGAAAAVGGAGCIEQAGSGSTTTGGSSSDAVTFGLAAPRSGPFNVLGEPARRGFELAVRHLNDGGGLVGTGGFDALGGDGVLDREVTATVRDTAGDPDTARSAARELASEAAVIGGAIHGDAALATSEVADETGTPYLVGSTPVDSLSGSRCSSVAVSELFGATTLARALLPVLFARLGTEVAFYNLSVDTAAGAALRDAVHRGASKRDDVDWYPTGSSTVIPGTTDFRSELRTVDGTVPDVVFLNLFGLDAVNAVQQARDVLGDGVELVVPLVDRPVAETAGDALDGVLGTVPWDPAVGSGAATPFREAYASRYGETPPGVAHHAYGRTLAFAAAAERADTFDLPAVREALVGREYDLGLGAERIRACDNQAVRPVPIVRGRGTDDGPLYDSLGVVSDATPSCKEPPASDCSLE